MWLMTKYGFYSIVQKAPGRYDISSRELQDLENLVQHVPLAGVQIQDTTGDDYSARVTLSGDGLQAILKFLGENIDYDDFPNTIEKTPDQAHKPYDRIGNILSCSLGAYGRKGSCSGEGTGSF